MTSRALAPIETWLRARGGIAHRREASAAGYDAAAVRSAARRETVRTVRRNWVITAHAPADLITAAEAGGRLACLSLARHRGWWIPENADRRLHLHRNPHDAAVPVDAVVHWTTPIAPSAPFALVEPIEDALAHIADCCSAEDALVIWESAARMEKLAADALRAVRWPGRAARNCADAVTGLSDSGLETIFVARMRPWGIPIAQQRVIAGRPVDVLIGDRLAVQLDGFAYHSSPADRRRDMEHDAELMHRGYTVLRFSYSQVLHDWPHVARTIARAIARGAHLTR
jgi:very-short-patch-repair endonuclease